VGECEMLYRSRKPVLNDECSEQNSSSTIEQLNVSSSGRAYPHSISDLSPWQPTWNSRSQHLRWFYDMFIHNLTKWNFILSTNSKGTHIKQ